VSDRWGNVASYTNTIESYGGNGVVVPGHGFLLNNELTDFDFVPPADGSPDPNLPAAGKRPRSSMSPTIVLRNGRPFLAVGSPGGSTIITTVLQILVNRLDFGMDLESSIAAPRASQRNEATTEVETAWFDQPTTPGLQALGHSFETSGDPYIGMASGLEFRGQGLVLAAGEPVRYGGSAAAVVDPALGVVALTAPPTPVPPAGRPG
jgi:gamma-glutamyltranspeptidase/glutathione hydrolase